MKAWIELRRKEKGTYTFFSLSLSTFYYYYYYYYHPRNVIEKNKEEIALAITDVTTFLTETKEKKKKKKNNKKNGKIFANISHPLLYTPLPQRKSVGKNFFLLLASPFISISVSFLSSSI